MIKRITSLFGILACLTVVAVLGAVIMTQNKTAGADSMDVMGSRKEHTSQEPSGQNAGVNDKDTGSSGKSGNEAAVLADQSGDAGQADSKQSDKTKKKNTNKKPGKEEKAIQKLIGNMTLEDKIAQLFILTPESFVGTGPVTKAGQATKDALDQRPIGGFAYFAQNIRSEEQFTTMVWNAQQYSMERTGLPLFIGVDEEGGSVARISGQGLENVPQIPNMSKIGKEGDASAAYEIGQQIGAYLKRFLVNVDFAPVADVYSNADNHVIRKRSFGSDPAVVASMVAEEVRGLHAQGIKATLKHFPGHGNTAQDSHKQTAYSKQSLEELKSCELLPFQAGIDAGADFVMAGHISFPNILKDDTPASLSYQMLTELLREEMGFEGIIITDALNMDAITSRYNSAQAAVQAIEAGADLILMPQDFTSAYDALIQAVQQDKIKESRIDASLMRILKAKKAQDTKQEETQTTDNADAQEQDSKVIVIDAGHQKQQDSSKEPIGPGAAEQKQKVSSGTKGVASGLNEYELTLQVALKLQRALEEKGYDVLMVRTSNDVNISNSERAEIANQAQADAFIRIHADGSEDPDASGAMSICPTKNNPYCSEIYKKSRKLSDAVLQGIADHTGAKIRGIWETDTMSGINWCKVPVTILEMGFMSNREEDLLMAQDSYQNKIVEGITAGMDKFFKSGS